MLGVIGKRNIMPIYVYKCENEECEQTTEAIRKFDAADDEMICQECGAQMKRFIGSSAVVELKGGDQNGWSPRTHTQMSKRRLHGK